MKFISSQTKSVVNLQIKTFLSCNNDSTIQKAAITFFFPKHMLVLHYVEWNLLAASIFSEHCHCRNIVLQNAFLMMMSVKRLEKSRAIKALGEFLFLLAFQ